MSRSGTRLLREVASSVEPSQRYGNNVVTYAADGGKTGPRSVRVNLTSRHGAERSQLMAAVLTHGEL